MYSMYSPSLLAHHGLAAVLHAAVDLRFEELPPDVLKVAVDVLLQIAGPQPDKEFGQANSLVEIGQLDIEFLLLGKQVADARLLPRVGLPYQAAALELVELSLDARELFFEGGELFHGAGGEHIKLLFERIPLPGEPLVLLAALEGRGIDDGLGESVDHFLYIGNLSSSVLISARCLLICCSDTAADSLSRSLSLDLFQLSALRD